MLRLRPCLLAALLRAAAPLPAASLHHLPLSTAATAVTTPAQFVAEDYLVSSCGLTPAQARKASKLLPCLRSPANPDAVRAFLVGLGLAKADVAAAVVRYPLLLRCQVDKTLTPSLAQLREIGLSPSQISGLVTTAPAIFVSPVKISRLAFYLSFLGSYDKVLQALKRHDYLLRLDFENVVRPNISLLQHCGLTDHDIAKLLLNSSGILLSNPERVKDIVVRTEELGVPRNSWMFKRVVQVLSGLNHVTFNAKMGFLKKILECSEAKLGIAVRKDPTILAASEGKMGRVVEFLKVEVGLEPSYILHRLSFFRFSIERRMMPRNYVIKVLKAKGLLKKEVDFYNAVCSSEKRFVERFVVCHNESVPGLIDAYAAACTGQAPLKI